MITQQNLKEVLELLGFERLDSKTESKIAESNKLESKQAHIYTKTINSYIMQVDFANQKLIYPQGIKIHDTTTSNFSHPENFVVFECVHRLLEKGYKVESKSIKYQNHIIQAFDNDEYLQENDMEKSYKNANGVEELFEVWKESYKLQFFTQGIFENDVNAYKILETTPTFSKLKEEGKYHEFAKILRKHNISSKENALDKLVNIFLCKIYDESFNKTLRF